MYYMYIDYMKFISHRGNTNGPNKKEENKPSYIINTLNMGFDVEIDIWFINNKLYLGHDNPDYEISLDFLKNDKLWCHTKNFEALEFLLCNNIHCFWHNTDDYVITSKGFIWTFPGKYLGSNSICVMPEINDDNFNRQCYGICSDYIQKYIEF